MKLNELITAMAILEERDELDKLDEIGLPPGNAIPWLFGPTAGFYFADGETRQIRQAMLGLALRYYDLAEGNTNLLSFNERTRRISAGKQIEEYLSQGEYYDERETASFYIRHMPKQALRSTDPVHDYFTALLPSAGYRGGNGRLMYQTRLSELSRDPTGVVRLFIDACRDLRVFYAVSGMSLFFYSYAAGATEKAYPLFRRFPGLLYEDGSNFTLEILRRTDVIRDVNWLTAVNNELLERVGGLEKAREVLGDEIVLHPYEGGVVFQAGERPVLGDLNKGRVPAAYRAVNDFLKPLRYENWDYPYLRAPYGVDEMEYTQWWTRRFDDQR
ncbi:MULTISPECIES: type VI immunity family protein [Agrobacterium]|uniref:DUF3396 domain-containing protein n=1 Tax=Agrobacterium tomkonis CFBP 6623 TaxID=1183432 RepID=A0A1S7RPM9_9HYPH|nr:MULTISPECIES: type VI immunity family protein [Agrobacterium]QCL91757.1 DUF3396 domain-containing protein [Agrobacterium tumefaciens]TKT59069.1 DUF3396 domain-containing protein [Agrobacterium sp. LC34]CUX55621.1 conserved hypothetical protein [Agrobacterium tomkonis CFBP 6623]